MLILPNVTKTVKRKTTSHLSLCRRWEMSVCVAWSNEVPDTSCASWWSCVCFTGVQATFWHCDGVILWKRYLVIALCIVFLFSPLFELFMFFNLAFHLPFPLDPFSWEVTDLLQCSHTYGQPKQISVLQTRTCLAKILYWDSTSCTRGTPGVFPFCWQLAITTAEVPSVTLPRRPAMETSCSLTQYLLGLTCPLEFLQAPITIIFMPHGLPHRLDSLHNFQLCLSMVGVPQLPLEGGSRWWTVKPLPALVCAEEYVDQLVFCWFPHLK